jgi:hypothetical protein
VCDLLGHVPCTPFHYEYTSRGDTKRKDVLLDEHDPVWRNHRYEDMGSLIDTVDEGVRTANARADADHNVDRSDLNAMRKLLKKVAGDEKLVSEKFAQHYHMKNEVVQAFERRNIHEVVTLEQVLVTGCDADGNKVPSKELERQMRGLVADERLT